MHTHSVGLLENVWGFAFGLRGGGATWMLSYVCCMNTLCLGPTHSFQVLVLIFASFPPDLKDFKSSPLYRITSPLFQTPHTRKPGGTAEPSKPPEHPPQALPGPL